LSDRENVSSSRSTEKDPFDSAHTIAQAAVGALVTVAAKDHGIDPVAAGVIGKFGETIFSKYVAQPISGRAHEFDQSLRDELEVHRAQIKFLVDHTIPPSPEFVSAYQAALSAAVKTHRQEKLEALRNAVVNVAVGFPESRASHELLLSMIDQLTWLHLKVLKVLADATTEFRVAGYQPPGRDRIGIIFLLTNHFRDWQASHESLDVVLLDLEQRRLIRTDGSKLIRVQGNGQFDKPSTPLGDELLKFISEPPSA
jgi:hypothetical protein